MDRDLCEKIHLSLNKIVDFVIVIMLEIVYLLFVNVDKTPEKKRQLNECFCLFFVDYK